MRFRFDVPSCIIVIVSTPAPIATSAPSCRISWAAIAIACEPEEQNRVTVVAATSFGNPAAEVHVLDLRRIEIALAGHDLAQHMRGVVDRLGDVERAAVCLGEAGSD